MEALLLAAGRVYDSVKNQEAMEYRRKWHRPDQEEQMGLLIQRVAGERIGDLYYPAIAGMGCSYNPYKWMEHYQPGSRDASDGGRTRDKGCYENSGGIIQACGIGLRPG
mgnify:CR=1 FL=1